MRKPAEFVNFPAALSAHAAYGPYRGVVRHVVDGDTLDVMLDLGLNDYCYRTLRLRGIDTPELNTVEGREVRDYVRQLLPLGTYCVVSTFKDVTTFGRYVADVRILDARVLGITRDLAEAITDAFPSIISTVQESA